MKIIGIIQARLNSSRLPEKVLMDICGSPVIEHVYNRAAKTENIGKIILATSVNDDDNRLADFAIKKGFNLFRGSKDNVLERYYFCASENHADIIVRFTGDNLLIDPKINMAAVDKFLSEKKYDYMKYGINLPIGTNIEVFTYHALKKAYNEASDHMYLEHVTPYIYKNEGKFSIALLKHNIGDNEDYSHLRWTLDTTQDFELINSIYRYFSGKGMSGNNFGIEDILDAYKTNPKWYNINKDVPQIQV